jgi:hypothetical protein
MFKYSLLYFVNCGSLAEFYAIQRNFGGKIVDGDTDVVNWEISCEGDDIRKNIYRCFRGGNANRAGC